MGSCRCLLVSNLELVRTQLILELLVLLFTSGMPGRKLPLWVRNIRSSKSTLSGSLASSRFGLGPSRLIVTTSRTRIGARCVRFRRASAYTNGRIWATVTWSTFGSGLSAAVTTSVWRCVISRFACSVRWSVVSAFRSRPPCFQHVYHLIRRHAPPVATAPTSDPRAQSPNSQPAKIKDRLDNVQCQSFARSWNRLPGQLLDIVFDLHDHGWSSEAIDTLAGALYDNSDVFSIFKTDFGACLSLFSAPPGTIPIVFRPYRIDPLMQKKVDGVLDQNIQPQVSSRIRRHHGTLHY